MSQMKTLAILLLFLAALCVLLSVISDIVDTSQFHESQRKSSNKSPLSFDGEAGKLFWFVQVTDIHISKFFDFKRAPDLLDFCQNHLKVISPEFVLASGDLTDAKFPDRRGSKQFVEEWKVYRKTVTTCRKILNGIKWLDLRGNHDTFNVPSANDPLNLYRKYSIQGLESPNSYFHVHRKPFGKYSFIALDACLDPGPKRPFNFFGYLNSRQKGKLEQFSKMSSDSNMTIWFGHYPTSLIVPEDGSDVRHLMRNSTAYLCGHLHTLADMVPKMYTRHKTGMLELELGDWKDNRIYRVLAVDHDTLSFTDEKLGKWPVVLVTNPAHAMFYGPKSPTHQITNSTHIRVLVFSPDEVTSVEISIDGIKLGEAKHVSGPLYVLPWTPAVYGDGLHSIKVVVEDAALRQREVSQPFSMDRTQVAFSLLPKLVLMLNVYTIGKLIFYALASFYLLLLFFLRIFKDSKDIQIKISYSCLKPLASYINCWIYRLWLVARNTSLYYWLSGFVIYIAIGPWFVAEVIQGHNGILFIWGMYVKGTLLPGSLSYIYGVFQIVTFNIPLLLFLGYMLNYQQIHKLRQQGLLSHPAIHLYIPFSTLILFQLFITITEFPRAYGSRAIVLGPVRTGSLFLALYVYYLCHKVGVKLRESSHRS